MQQAESHTSADYYSNSVSSLKGQKYDTSTTAFECFEISHNDDMKAKKTTKSNEILDTELTKVT